MFSNSAEVLRTASRRTTLVYSIQYLKRSEGRRSRRPVQSGDVVMVTVRLLAQLLLRLLTVFEIRDRRGGSDTLRAARRVKHIV